MEPPIDPEESSPSVERMILLGGSGFLIGLIVFLTIVGLVLRARAQPMAPVAPTQECRPSTLVLGETTFQIQILPLGSGGLSDLPAEAGVAYWVKGTEASPVFVLSPAPENLAVVSTIGLGSEATATWSDCTITSYPVSAHEPGAFNTSALSDRPREGITVFFPIDASGAGFVFTAGITGEPAFVSNQPTPQIQSTRPASAANSNSPSLESTMPPSIENLNPTSTAGIILPSAENTIAPPIVPTMDCDTANLSLGTSTFEIQKLVLDSDSSLSLPSDSEGIAYWLESAEGNHLFVLGPTPENISLGETLTEGMTAEVIWTDCSSLTFDLSTPASSPEKISDLLNELTSGITVFIETDSSGEGMVFRGDLTELTFPQ